jgi:hypothetical protein
MLLHELLCKMHSGTAAAAAVLVAYVILPLT